MIDYKLIYELYNCKGLGRVKINSIITQFFAETNLSKEDINLKILNFIKSNYDSILDFEKFEEDVYEIEKKQIKKFVL